jgi:uncharacterized Tic20 family protein
MTDQQGWGPENAGNRGYGQSGPAPSQLSPQDERLWGTLSHVAALVFAFIALAFIGPLLVLLIQGPKSPYVRQHAVEALNFNITVLIAAAVSGVLTAVLIGFPMLVAIGIFWLVCTILAILAANRGEMYRYPLTLRLVS